MRIWVDGDACPGVVKDIVYRAAERTASRLTLVANRPVRVPRSSYIQFLQVSLGRDVADNEIVARMDADDLVITGDIPLAARVVEKGGLALNPRGEIYSAENVQERLSTRDFMDSLRLGGVETGGPSALSKRDRQAFANSLDQLLQKFAHKG